MKLLFRRPKLCAILATLLTLAAGSTAMYLANFGVPFIVYIPLFLILCTVGLPTTLGVIIVACIWGRLPLLTGRIGFFLAAALLGLVLQMTACVLVSRWFHHRKAQPA